MTRTAADITSEPVIPVDPKALRRLLDAYDVYVDAADDEPHAANIEARALRSVVDGWDPDAELVEAMCAAWARDDWDLDYEGPTREEYRQRMREVHAELVEREACFHPDHQGADHIEAQRSRYRWAIEDTLTQLERGEYLDAMARLGRALETP